MLAIMSYKRCNSSANHNVSQIETKASILGGFMGTEITIGHKVKFPQTVHLFLQTLDSLRKG